ncbi:glycosyltransferase 87 family protein [Salinispora fenicalii]|uniref:glycosyltransferase 87 family protein n=1 Tax=Salinispora fenicalii TaxID=1137263 RepID=UPI0004888CE5|nr:glycosyltransferase 87 family protein [Salinispora fenicalii]
MAALLLAVVTDEGPHRVWGLCAAIGYAVAGALAAGASRGLRRVAPFVAVVGVAVVPMVWLVTHRQGQLEVDVVHHSGALLLHTGSPYLPEPSQLEDYNPYLPAMALFGLPYALFGDGPLTDARWGFALVFGLALVVAARITVGHCAPRALALLAAFPLLALPLATGGIDLPVTALMCLALATAAAGRPAATGLAAGAAAAMKWTAWPVLAVVLVLLTVRRGGRAAAGAGAAAAAVLAVLTVPSFLVSPGAFVEQVLRYPLGAGQVASPAGSPLPGHLVATLLPGGRLIALVLLASAAVAVAVLLVGRPPRTLLAAADRLAFALAVAICLAPATRFGYLLMPVTIAAWFRLHPGSVRVRGSAVLGLGAFARIE